MRKRRFSLPNPVDFNQTRTEKNETPLTRSRFYLMVFYYIIFCCIPYCCISLLRHFCCSVSNFTFKSKCAKSQSLIDFHRSLICWFGVGFLIIRLSPKFKIQNSKNSKIKFQSKLNVRTWNIRTNSFCKR